MDYEKKYPITQMPGRHIKGMWTRGYREVEIWYNERLVFTHRGIGQLKKGVSYHDNELGRIELKLSDKPMMMDVIIDGYHSPSNISHPERELKKTSAYFWILFVFSLISIGTTGMSFGVHINPLEMSIGMLFSVAYLISAILVGQKIAWGFFVGFGFFCLSFLMGVLALPLGLGGISLIAFTIRTVFLIFLIRSLKYATETIKHKKYARPVNDALIDG